MIAAIPAPSTAAVPRRTENNGPAESAKGDMGTPKQGITAMAPKKTPGPAPAQASNTMPHSRRPSSSAAWGPIRQTTAPATKASSAAAASKA